MGEKMDRWTSEEFMSLHNFLVEKTKNVESPMDIKELAEEFKEQTGVERSLESCERKMRTAFTALDYDDETKVKIIFALGGSIDDDYLNELRKKADVVLDNCHRIVSYKSKEDGGLELSGDHSAKVCTNAELDQKIIDFLIEKIKTVKVQMAEKAFLKEFKQSTGVLNSLESLTKRYRAVKNRIHKSKEFSEEMKIRMLFISGASLQKPVLTELKKNAIVDVDSRGKIRKYAATDGSFMITRGRNSTEEKITYPITPISPVTDIFWRSFNAMKSKAYSEVIELDDVEKPPEEYPLIDLTLDDEEDIVDEEESLKRKRTEDEENSKIKREKSMNENTFDSFTGDVGEQENPSKTPVAPEVPSTETAPSANSQEPTSTQTNTPSLFDGEDVFNIDPSLSSVIVEPEDFYKYLEDNEPGFVEEPKEEEAPMPIVPIEPETHTPLLKILEAFETILAVIDSSKMADLHNKIGMTIVKEQLDPKKIPIDSIRTVFDAVFHMIQERSVVEASLESMSLKELLINMRCIIVGLKMPILFDLQKKLREKIDSLDSQDKRIPITSIEYALRVAHNIIYPENIVLS